MTSAVQHGPTVAAMSVAVTAVQAGTAPFCDNAGLCPAEVVRQFGARAVEDQVFCDIMCCCRTAVGTGARQQCVQDTLDAADQALGHQSRYKAEFSYNMTTVPPSPFMHRSGAGQQRSTYWQGRTRDEIPGYTRGAGMVRRPDIVVVRNPSLPPTQDNIERIVEMKFRDDPPDVVQMAAYQTIAGPRALAELRQESTCNRGSDNRRRVPFPVPVPLPVPRGADQVEPEPVPIPVGPDENPNPFPDPLPDGLPAPSPGALAIVGLGLLTLGLALSPFDGPFGDMAAGAAFLGAWGVGGATTGSGA